MSDRGVLTVISGFSGKEPLFNSSFKNPIMVCRFQRQPDHRGRGSRMVENISSKQKKSLRK